MTGIRQWPEFVIVEMTAFLLTSSVFSSYTHSNIVGDESIDFVSVETNFSRLLIDQLNSWH